MAIKVERQAAVPDGHHAGVIVGCEETTRVFDPAHGPEEVVLVTIQPAWKDEGGAQTVPVSVTFTPVLNGLSALSQFLQRIGQEPEDGAVWKPQSIVGVEVEFDAKHNDRGFVNIAKDSITAAT